MYPSVRSSLSPVLAALLCALLPAVAAAQDAADAMFVTVPNPLTSDAVTRIKNQITARVNSENAQRRVATVVFDFNPDDKPALTPDFGECSNLAEFIGAQKAITTIAFVHAPVTGHTVLPVLACTEVVMGKSGVIGPIVVEGVAGLKDYQKGAYRERFHDPDRSRWPLVQKMFDAEVKLVRGGKREGKGTLFADARDANALAQLSGPEPVKGVTDGQYAAYNLDLAYNVGGVGLAKRKADTRAELASLYSLPPSVTRDDPLQGRTPVAFQWTLKGDVDGAMKESVGRVLRDVRKKKGNVFILILNCGGTDLDAARELAADLIAAQKGDEPLQIIAFIPESAPDAAAVVALGCTEIVMTRPKSEGDGKEADFGNFERYLKSAKPTAIASQKTALRQLAKEQGYPEVLIDGMLDVSTEIVRVRDRTDSRKKQLMTREQFKDAQERKEEWVEDKVVKAPGVPFHPGATLAAEIGLARFTVPTTNVNDVCAIYGVSEAKNPDPGLLDRFAEFLRIPAVTIILVMLGFIGLILELKVPGLTVPGIIAALCFILVFWSQSRFSGEMFVLALLLFIMGLVLVGLEIFVLPGFGACGIFGIICMLGGLGLVTMEKVPENTAGWIGFGVRVSTYMFAMMGAVVFAFLIAKFLPQVPGANRLMLTPPAENTQTAEAVLPGASEALELLGAIGTSTTALRPAGVVRFGDKFVDVVSDGGYIPLGTRVQVVAVEATRIVVKEV